MCGPIEDKTYVSPTDRHAGSHSLILFRVVAKFVQFQLWERSFVLIFGYWPHIGPVLGATLWWVWWPEGLPQGARELPRDNAEATQIAPPAAEVRVFVEHVLK